ncbi:MAG: aldehyde dehydrogenase family protein [Anaerolineae bacterium]|nr:aldehyde dehydrogenase family protein [Anaerolineae bacterium]
MSRITEIFQTMQYGPAPEAATPAQAWLTQHQRQFGHFINGQFTPHVAERAFDAINPANANVIAKLTQASADEVDAAVNAASQAFATWRETPGHVRARYLYAIARHIQKQSRLFAVLETLDNGKTIRETRDIDIPLVARHFYHHAGWAQVMQQELPNHEPIGVIGQIIPWNFPLLMLAWKIAPALAMGNTVVLKPAEWTSLTALLFGEVCQAVGLPPGVVNIVTGDGEVGKRIVNHAGVQKIAFTGSTEVGRAIRSATAGTGKKLSLELGGKSPFIVFDDADLDSTVEGVVDAIWFNQGQVCCAGSRLLVQESVADKLIAKLKARMETLRIGDPLDKTMDIGAIIAPPQLEKVTRLVAQGQQEGAVLWQPSWCSRDQAGYQASVGGKGYFFPPTLFTEVQPASTLAQVEIFGPVLVAMSFRTHSEAVSLANNTRYGLAASIWSENINLALDVAPKLKAGVVWINCTNQFDAAAGFGGYRESGYGREGGKEGLFEYVKRKTNEQWTMDNGQRAVGNGLGDAPKSKIHTIDRTPKLYIGGKQARPDSGYSRIVYAPSSDLIGEVADGSRKDIRNAVEAAHAARGGWGNATAHNRAQVLYYLAENLSIRAGEFAARLMQMQGIEAAHAQAEVEATIQTLFTFAAMCDKFDGAVHATPMRNVTLAMNEAIGVIGIACPDEQPLLATVKLMAAAISMGNTVVLIPSEQHPLSATDLYQVLDTSDVPGGVVNIITGERDALSKTLAEHLDVDAMWYFGSANGSAMVEKASVGNLKRTWVGYGKPVNWFDASDTDELLRHATQVKNIWVPYGA